MAVPEISPSELPAGCSFSTTLLMAIMVSHELLHSKAYLIRQPISTEVNFQGTLILGILFKIILCPKLLDMLLVHQPSSDPLASQKSVSSAMSMIWLYTVKTSGTKIKPSEGVPLKLPTSVWRWRKSLLFFFKDCGDAGATEYHQLFVKNLIPSIQPSQLPDQSLSPSVWNVTLQWMMGERKKMKGEKGRASFWTPSLSVI